MTTDKPSYWPFPIPSDNMLTEEHRKEIRFLEAAYQAGFRPCMYQVGGGEYQAHAEQGRDGWIVSRGGYRNGAPTRWEVCLNDSSGQVAAYWVDDFDAASASVLKWLEGGDIHDILDSAKPRIIRGPGLNVPLADLSGQ
jgi:hypothetical protein